MAKLNFRQGIARRQQDSSGNPNNLQPSNGGSWIDLIVSPDATVFSIAHYDVDYMQTENGTVAKAWGPFTSGIDYWLYWDVDFLTGELTRQYTTVEPTYGNTVPASPSIDKHWYDTEEMVMKVWTGSSWIEKIRVFAAKYASGATLIHYPLGSQIGYNNASVNAGVILFDPDGKPLQKFQRNRRGQFITSETPLNSQFNRIANFRVEAAIVQGEAQESIPINHAVALSGFDELVLARSSNTALPAIGIATEDMNPGEVRSYITKGFIRDEVNWDWDGYPARTALFVGANGELIPAPEANATTQQEIGYIVNKTTIFIDVSDQVSLEPPSGNEVGLLVDRDTGQKIGRKIPFTIDDLNDTDVDNPQDGDVISWDSSLNKWVLDSNCCGGGGPGGGASTLNELTDVDSPSPVTDGYSLTFNATTQRWEPSPKVSSLSDLDDVVSLPNEGDNLIFRGSWWVSEPATSTDEFVKATAADTTTGYLNTKLVAGTGVNFNTLNIGANEQIEISSTATGTGGGAGLFVTGVSSPGGGIVSDFVYESNTVPANIVVDEATSDQEIVRIEFLVEGDSTFYSPTVLVDTPTGNVPGVLTQDPDDIRTFHGYADVSIADGLTAGRIVTLEASHGATATVLIKRAPEASQITSMSFDGTYPTVAPDPATSYSGGTQTTIKSGDYFYVSGTVENSAVLVTLNSGDAVSGGTFTTNTTGSNLGANDSAGAGYKSFTIRFTASSASGTQTATAVAQNTFGSNGPAYTTSNTVMMDQLSPNVSINSVIYPAGQTALKGSETAAVSNSVSGQDYVYYYENGGAGNLLIANQSTYEASKIVARAGGDYVYNGNNFAIKAYKTSNGTSTTNATGDVNISNVAPTVSISGASSRLISSPTGENYTITLTFSQMLTQAPTITSSGDITAGDRGSISGSGTTWTFSLNVDDADDKGVHNWTVDGIETLSNNSYNNVSITSGNSYEIGGFTSRLVTVGALEPVVDLGVDITDPTKVTVKYAGTADDLTYRGSDLTLFQKGWSAVAGTLLIYTPGPEPFPNYSNFIFQDPVTTPTSWLFLTDSNFAGVNTTGTLQLEIVEVA